MLDYGKCNLQVKMGEISMNNWMDSSPKNENDVIIEECW